ncbi:conjugal transfer protein TrbL [Leucobacter ruminantium]|uniref:Conjugal transfer protein TrbL n=1 Tax=Leucobacter ruminantium TaxID=1289170 RepID=A0A939LUR9_9MICO|nr:conjugal transfer protein TrbL [Leucobacter ruminantium]MBO1804466.1 conjugal transfer protein TrbL [Leucobacter ruminantium]
MSLCDIPLLSEVCSFVGEAPARLVTAPFDWAGQAMANSAAWMVEALWVAIDSTTLVDVTTDGFVSVYNLVFGIGVLISLIFFFLQLITGLIRRDPGALRHAFLGLARSILGSFVVITLTALLLEAVDQLCIGLVQAAGESMETLGDKFTLLMIGLGGLNLTSPGVAAILMIFVGFLAIAGTAILWFSLLIRKGLILVTVVLAPLALSGTVWEHARGWVGKWAAFLVAMIVSKLVVVIVFLVGTSQLAAPIDLDIQAVADPLSGIVLLLIASFASYMSYKLIAFIGFDLYQTLSSEQEAKEAVNRRVPVPHKPQKKDDSKKVLDDKSGEGKGKGGGSGSPSKSGTKPPSNPTPDAGTGGSATPAAGAEGSAGSAGAGTAGAGVAAPVVAGAAIVVGTAKAGVDFGKGVGQEADAHAGAPADSESRPMPPSAPPPTIAPNSKPLAPPPAQPSE